MSEAIRSLGRHAIVGCSAIAIVIVGFGGWAGTTEIAGAVIAPGTVVTELGSKRVQHPEGGVVREILVEEGDAVEAGQLLVRLDGTAIAANLAVIVGQLNEAFALEARLTAESTGADAMRPSAALSDWPDRAALDKLFAAQDQLRRSRAAARAGLAAQIEEQIAQLGEQIEGIEAERKATETELDILDAERRDTEALFNQGLVQASRVSTIRRDVARLEGQAGSLAADIAAARTAIAEKRSQIAQDADAFEAEVLQDLRATGSQIAELLQQKIAAEDRLARLDIRAPQAGVVHESVVRTVGGVVAAGETLMLVVPQQSRLALDTWVSPLDIDKLSLAQPVAVRLVGLDTRATPELVGSVTSISPDLSHDAVSGAAYYAVKVAIAETELQKLPEGEHLLPGMPAEAFMRTSDRTVLSYLVAPFVSQLSHAFRED